jgi:hypothetical protein
MLILPRFRHNCYLHFPSNLSRIYPKYIFHNHYSRALDINTSHDVEIAMFHSLFVVLIIPLCSMLYAVTHNSINLFSGMLAFLNDSAWCLNPWAAKWTVWNISWRRRFPLTSSWLHHSNVRTKDLTFKLGHGLTIVSRHSISQDKAR